MRTLVIILVLLQLAAAQNTCPENCQACDPSGMICFACQQGYEVNVLGGCTTNVIDKCTIYGPTEECFNCQPTYTLDELACVKDYSGCVLGNANDGSCFECGFGTEWHEQYCTGVINCHTYTDGQCEKCAQGYQLKNNICIDVSQGCKKVREQDGICAECEEEYVQSGYACVKKSITVSRCYIYNSEAECLYCKNGYNMYENQCLLNHQIHERQRLKLQQGIEHCQVPNTHNLSQCLVCQYGYYPGKGKCLEVSRFCGEHNVQTGECFTCKHGRILEEGKCKDKNCQVGDEYYCTNCFDGYDVDGNGVCQVTSHNCLEVVNNRCEKCREGYYVDSVGVCKKLPLNCAFVHIHAGMCMECEKGFELQPSGTCTKMLGVQNCEVPNPQNTSQCLICVYGWYPSNGNCKKVSPMCKDHNVQTGHCLTCKQKHHRIMAGACVDSNCVSVDAATSSCTECKESFSLADGECRKQQKQEKRGSDMNCVQFSEGYCVKCSNKYYLNDNKCIPINPLCKTHNQIGQCTSCYRGYVITNGQCRIGRQKDTNCRRELNGHCEECYHGYFYNSRQSKCERLNPLCNQSDSSNGHCLSCYPGYKLNPARGTCDIYFKDPNCKSFNNQNQCTLCSVRFYVKDGSCTPVSPLCQGYNEYTGYCTSCYKGYQIQNNACVKATKEKNNCKAEQNGYCTACYQDAYLVSGKCEKVSSLCRTHAYGKCTSCYEGYKLVNGACYVGRVKDPNCQHFQSVDSHYCVSCYAGYLAIQGECQTQNPLCKTLNKGSGLCTSCWPGYQLVQGDCLNQNQIKSSKVEQEEDLYCLEKQFGVCRKCVKGFYYQQYEGKCKAVSPLCKGVDYRDGSCTDCYKGYSLSDGECVVAKVKEIPYCAVPSHNGCTQCIQSYYFNGQECSAVSILCDTYDHSTGKCLSCVSGHFLQEGECIFPALFDSNCLNYESAYCSRCAFGFYLQNYQCYAVDNRCYQFDYANNKCEGCVHGFQPHGKICQ